MTASESPYWTAAEAAAYLRRPVGTLRYWRHTGTGPRSVRLGNGNNSVRYRVEDVKSWAEQQEHASAVGGGVVSKTLRDALRKAAGTGLAALMFVAVLWASPYVRTAWPHQRPADQVTVDVTAARAGERLVDWVEFATDLTGATPAAPGVRPSFVPSAALVVRDGEVHAVPLGEALAGRTGRIVAWVP